MKRMISPEELAKVTPDFKEGITTKSLVLGNVKLEEDEGFGGLHITNPRKEVKLPRGEGEIYFKSGSPNTATWPNIKLSHEAGRATQEILFMAYSTNGKTYVSIDASRAGKTSMIPLAVDPTEDGTYSLKIVKSGSSFTYKWVKDV